MKRQHWIILLVIALIAGGAWYFTRDDGNQLDNEQEQIQDENGEDEDTDEEQTEQATIVLGDYFFTEQDLRLNYAGEGYAHADKITWVAHKNGNIVQHMDQSAATTIAKVYEIGEDEITFIYAQEESYDEEDYTQVEERNRNKVVLKSPIEVGNQWEDEEMTYEIEAVNESLTVPFGTFEVIRVREKNKNGESESVNYYTERFGLIKSIFTGDNYEVIVELESVEE